MARSPCFRFYPREFLSDLHVQAMSAEELGYYMKLQAQYWISEGLPNDPDQLARVLKISRKTFDRVWRRIGLCFTRRGSRLKHTFLDAERAHQEEFRQKASVAGRKGMASRWAKRDDNGRYPVVITPDNSSSSTSDSASDSKDRDPGEAGVLEGGTGGAARQQEHRPDGRNPSRKRDYRNDQPNVDAIVKVQYELDQQHQAFATDFDRKQALKDRCAALGLPHDGGTINQALDRVDHHRARKVVLP
jgi:uncharacterized protein YdaU (DUF1376 family)